MNDASHDDDSDAAGREVSVLHVPRRHAKTVKSALQAAHLLHKDFRMTPSVAQEDCIAIPVTTVPNGGPWNIHVQSTGIQWCPYSTAVLGSGRHVLADGRTLTPLHRAVLTAAMPQAPNDLEKTLWQTLDALPRHTFPTTPLEVWGDDRTLVLPHRAFVDDDDDHPFFATLPDFYKHLAAAHGSRRIVRRGGVDPDSPIRQSGYRIVYPYIANGISKETGPGSPGWIRVTEQGIRQSLDMTRVMFSRGNISEKIRFGKQLVQPGDVVLDLYAGIGYYTLPALVHGRAQHVVACEWNAHAASALRYNVRDNGIAQDRVQIYEGDCRETCQEYQLVNMFDRVSLGLLPSSQGGWRTAVKALKSKTGGWLHVHANVPVAEKQAWALWLCQSLALLCVEEDRPTDWVVIVHHVERVKSFAPTVAHFVADVFVGKREVYSGQATVSIMDDARAGIVVNGKFQRCPDKRVEPPSCALSESGALSQEWMR